VWGRFDVIGRLGVRRFAMIGRAKRGGFDGGRCFAVIGRTEKLVGASPSAMLSTMVRNE